LSRYYAGIVPDVPTRRTGELPAAIPWSCWPGLAQPHAHSRNRHGSRRTPGIRPAGDRLEDPHVNEPALRPPTPVCPLGMCPGRGRRRTPPIPPWGMAAVLYGADVPRTGRPDGQTDRRHRVGTPVPPPPAGVPNLSSWANPLVGDR